MKKIQAVSVCVNYSDFFIHSAKANKDLFDKWVVVTDFKDAKTKDICEQYNIVCIQTDVFYEKGGFNKYAGINEGLKYIDKDAWVVFLDSDIVLPPYTKRVLNEIELDKRCLYGIDRVNCTGIGNWQKYKSNPNHLIDNWLLHAGDMSFGARIVHIYGQQGENGKFGGFKPLGFFQLVHKSSFIKYPQDSLGADHCDIEFANYYHRTHRILIPEMLGIHLESEGSEWGDNWYGRKSAEFGSVQESKILTFIKEAYWFIVKLWRKFLKLFKKKLCYGN